MDSLDCNGRQTSATHTYEIGQLVLLHCEDSAASQQCQQYSGCWGIVHHIDESAAVVAVGGEMVSYLLCHLEPIENPSPALKQVSDRVKNWWQMADLPASAQCLLGYYPSSVTFRKHLPFLNSRAFV